MEPRIKYLTATAIYPQLQGAIDIWCPHILYDEPTYGKARKSLSLSAPKSIPAKVTASSFKLGDIIRQHSVVDVYDGCDYTFWMSHAVAPGQPQWLRFEFQHKASINGLSLLPYKSAKYRPYGMRIEIATNGDDFHPIAFRRAVGDAWRFKFPARVAESVRLIFTHGTDDLLEGQEPPSKPANVAFSEVEFHKSSEPSQAASSRLWRKPDANASRLMPSEIWEYNINATWPSSGVDAKPYEHRVFGFLLWHRGTTGYLNYGGAQWQLDDHLRQAMRFSARGRGFPPGLPLDCDKTLLWPAEHNAGEYLAWPRKDGPIPSIRMARLRDGMDDHDHLKIAQRTPHEHALLAKLRAGGGAAYTRSSRILRLRQQLAELILASRHD